MPTNVTGGSSGTNPLPPPPPDLTMNGAGVSASTKGIGQEAETLAASQGDTLTASEVNDFEIIAQAMLNTPQLSSPDKTALSNFLITLASYPVAAATVGDAEQEAPILTASGAGSGDLTIGGTPAAKPNIFLTPGVMALLAPVMSKLAETMRSQIMQSAVLRQAFMNLDLEMAKTGYNLTQDNAANQVAQLNVEVNQNIALAVSAIATAAVSVATYAISSGLTENASSTAGNNAYNESLDGAADDAADNFDYDGFKQTYRSNNPTATDDDTNMAANDAAAQAGRDARNAPANINSANQAYVQAYHKAQAEGDSQRQLAQGVVKNLGDASSSIITATFTAQKTSLTTEGALISGSKDEIAQLLQLVTQTITSSAEEGKVASQVWQQFLQDMQAISRIATAGSKG